MKKIYELLLAALLTLTIFLSVPQTVTAVSYSADKLNASACSGKKYTIKTYFPGIGYQKMNVRFDTVYKRDVNYIYEGHSFDAKKVKVNIHCSYPKSTLNKIRNNLAKLIITSKHKNTGLNRASFLLDANTGYIGKVYECNVAVIKNEKKMLIQKKENLEARYTLPNVWDLSYTVVYPAKRDGDFIVGVCGTSNETTMKNSYVTEFKQGNAPITDSAFYKNKMKKLSIWKRL